ncbi:MAG: UDP-4-amino-4,6-dideoxy-N-acetyl-beta-L-altrosamine transaminase [Phycisphaerales bacterium]|nr:UDP-4-amino-4,6-dideoxy-N-acetyl-beta-L-altrosamine transaminase [Phycisphaerales bacterium]
MLPYGRQTIDEADIAAVVKVLRSDWLTTGPQVEAFEQAFARRVGAEHAVAVNSGTAALAAAYHALNLRPDDEVIVPAITFASTANAVIQIGANPVIVDVAPDTLLIDSQSIEARITPRTRAIVAVDYAGQPCDYEDLRVVADRHGLMVVSDACHALGATWRGKSVGCLTPLTVFSFHPVKVITTGEGGMVTTSDSALAERMRAFRNHCITADFRERASRGSWEYTIDELGGNYRLSDMQCALGLSQLGKLDDFVARRRAVAARYDELIADVPGVAPLMVQPEVGHAYHLYVVRLEVERLTADRRAIFAALRAEGVGVNVHYLPVHLHQLYRERYGTKPGDCPDAEAAYERILSLPIFPGMSDADATDTVTALAKVLRRYQR